MYDNSHEKLLQRIKKAGGRKAFARKQNVNIFYVVQLLNRGIEPTDRTVKGREARAALFLPRRKRNQVTRPALPAWLKRTRKAISEMRRETRKALDHADQN